MTGSCTRANNRKHTGMTWWISIHAHYLRYLYIVSTHRHTLNCFCSSQRWAVRRGFWSGPVLYRAKSQQITAIGSFVGLFGVSSSCRPLTFWLPCVAWQWQRSAYVWPRPFRSVPTSSRCNESQVDNSEATGDSAAMIPRWFNVKRRQSAWLPKRCFSTFRIISV